MGKAAANPTVIETFRGLPDSSHSETKVAEEAIFAQKQEILARQGLTSAGSKEGCSKTTCFESPYWPGQHDFKSRGLLDSNSTYQNSATNLNT